MRWIGRLWPQRSGMLPEKGPTDLAFDQITAELQRHSQVAADRLSNPRFFDGQSGRHVARDELLALSYLRSIDLPPRLDEVEPAVYLQRVTAETADAKERFTTKEDDSDGFGAATFGEVMVFLEALLKRQSAAKPHPFRDRHRSRPG